MVADVIFKTKCLYGSLKVSILHSFSIKGYGNIKWDHIVSEVYMLNIFNFHVQAKAAEVFEQIQMRNVKPVDLYVD
jgi:hypothetical protein